MVLKNGQDLIFGRHKSGGFQNGENTILGQEGGVGIFCRFLDGVNIQIVWVRKDKLQIRSGDLDLAAKQIGKRRHTGIGDDGLGGVFRIDDPTDQRIFERGIVRVGKDILHLGNFYLVGVRGNIIALGNDLGKNVGKKGGIQLDQRFDDLAHCRRVLVGDRQKIAQRQRGGIIVLFQRFRADAGNQRAQKTVKVGEDGALFFKGQRGKFLADLAEINVFVKFFIVDIQRQLKHRVGIDGFLDAVQVAFDDGFLNDCQKVFLLVAAKGRLNDSFFVDHLTDDIYAAQVGDQSAKTSVILADEDSQNVLKRHDFQNVFQSDQVPLGLHEREQFLFERIGVPEGAQNIRNCIGG